MFSFYFQKSVVTLIDVTKRLPDGKVLFEDVSLGILEGYFSSFSFFFIFSKTLNLWLLIFFNSAKIGILGINGNFGSRIVVDFFLTICCVP